ncbi:MAG: hypothetical protein WBA74_18555 [Cyclobacteriaceae bacterium]
MNAINNSDDNYQHPGSGYEAHLFAYVLQHIKRDKNLSPEIAETIAENLAQEEYYGKYYLKINELHRQGLFDDSYTYAQYLMESEEEEETNSVSVGEATAPRSKQRYFRREPWRNIAAAVLVVIITALITYQMTDSTGGNGTISLSDRDGSVKSLGGENTETVPISFALDENIKHNSELQENYDNPVFCKMHLVFKGITAEGFIVRSKRRGIGNEDPFKEELEVRFSDSGSKKEITEQLTGSLKNRQFPEYIVRGLYEYGDDTKDKLPLLTVYELLPVQ